MAKSSKPASGTYKPKKKDDKKVAIAGPGKDMSKRKSYAVS